jgi:hypothetical protein
MTGVISACQREGASEERAAQGISRRSPGAGLTIAPSGERSGTSVDSPNAVRKRAMESVHELGVGEVVRAGDVHAVERDEST